MYSEIRSGREETTTKSCDKSYVEKNHALFRDICPKGTSFDHFTQETVDLIFSHVNSVARKKLNGKTPYELFHLLLEKKSLPYLESKRYRLGK